MLTLTRPKTPKSSLQPPRSRRRRFSPLMFIGIAVTLLAIVGAGIYAFNNSFGGGTHAAAVNMDCVLIVPPNPLTAQGLATPYQLAAANPQNGPCNEANANQAAFVQGAVFDPATGQISIYNPLVIDQGTQPAAAPVVPQVPAGAVVALWFGFNGATLTLQDSQGSLQAGNCVNGINGSIFGQFSYCNAPAFFQAANQAITAGKLVPPVLGMGKDGMTCPTVRDFSVVDQDQSDNVTTTYLVTGNGTTAQMTAANIAKLQNTQTQANGSDNRLLAVALDGALGCKPWMVNDLADPGHMVPALPLDELQAAARQQNPVALVPPHDPMVLVNGRLNRVKLNAYRAGVDQPPVQITNRAMSLMYCQSLLTTAPTRIFADAALTKQAASPDMGAANNLFTFLAQRFVTSWGKNGLNCQGLTRINSPIQVTTDGNGVAIDATLNGLPPGNGGGNGGGGNGGGGNGGTGAVNCTVNGNAIPGCMGTTTINGQQCTFAFDQATNQVSVTCPATQGNGGNNNGNGGNNNNGGANNNAGNTGNGTNTGNGNNTGAGNKNGNGGTPPVKPVTTPPAVTPTPAANGGTPPANGGTPPATPAAK